MSSSASVSTSSNSSLSSHREEPQVTSDLVPGADFRPAKKCYRCTRHHQKCIYSPKYGLCVRCRVSRNNCSFSGEALQPSPAAASLPWKPQRPPPQSAVPSTFLHTKPGQGPQVHEVPKCDKCREVHGRCLPLDREWPAKCKRCAERGLPCTPPRLLRDAEPALVAKLRRQARSRSGRDDSSFRSASGPKQNTEKPKVPIAVPATVEGAISGLADSTTAGPAASKKRPVSSDSSSSSSFEEPLAKREKLDSGAATSRAHSLASVSGTHSESTTGRSESELVSELRRIIELDVIRNTENDYLEALRKVQEEHKREMDAMKETYKKELITAVAAIKEHYEARVDRLIDNLRSIREHS